ncbi:hypothetical protein HD554DRAFT_2315777 [Boletus coccyginus]|nr:hypothetical protein HD554DRAFT_2315777 [Boletus coccyginus]
MLNTMCQQEWPADHLQMIRDFWVTIESHSWRHDPSKYRQRALLVYQGRIRKDWHKTLGTTDGFRLLPLHAGRLNKYHQELLDNAYATKIEAIRSNTIGTRACTHAHVLLTTPVRPASPSVPCPHPPKTTQMLRNTNGRVPFAPTHTPPPTLHPTSLSRHTPKRSLFYQRAPSVLTDINTRCPLSSAQPSAHGMTNSSDADRWHWHEKK